jgi:hypothetical protein
VWRPAERHYESNDTTVVGSDEVWSDLWGNVPGYFLADAPASTYRLAYAVSAGRSESLGASDHVPRWLEAFDAIHPRDSSTSELCVRTGATPGEVVCDPVMLVDPEWLRSLGTSGTSRAGYTLVYSEYCRRDLRINRIIEATGAPSRLLSVGFPYPGSEVVIGTGLSGFIGAVANAELIVTSMFHGLVTGLCLGKPVAILQHPAKAKKVSDLIARVEAQIVDEGSGYVVVEPTSKVDLFRNSSNAALAAALA